METTVHFSIEGEFITNHARNLWAEGEYRKAKDVLDCMIGMPEHMKFDLIRGKLKLTGVNEVSPEPDNWQRTDGCFYPDPEDIWSIAAEGNKAARLKERYESMIIGLCIQLISGITQADNAPLREDLEGLLNTFPEDVLERKGVSWTMGKRRELRFQTDEGFWLTPGAYYGHYYEKGIRYAKEEFIKAEKDFIKSDTVKVEKLTLAQSLNAGLMPDVDEYVKRQLELETLPLPEPDPECQSTNGYITVDGKFYPCEWMEHDWLANRLVEAGHKDRELVKCAVSQITPLSGVASSRMVSKISTHEPTSRQLTTVARWCLVHNYPYPKTWMHHD